MRASTIRRYPAIHWDRDPAAAHSTRLTHALVNWGNTFIYGRGIE